MRHNDAISEFTSDVFSRSWYAASEMYEVTLGIYCVICFEAQMKGSLDVPLVLCGQVRHLVCHL